MAKNKEQRQSFESSLALLEQVVAQLESGDLPLERALELFEEGVGLARHCQVQLEEAERKVEMLLKERGEIRVVPFETSRESQINHPEAQLADTTPTVSRTQAEEEPQGATEADSNDSVPF